MCLNALSKQFNLDALALGVQEFGVSMYKPAQGLILEAGRVMRSAYASDVAYRAITETIKLIDLETKTELVARPMMATIGATRAFIDATKLIHSISYLVNGSFYEDYAANKVVAMVSHVALAVGRAMSTLHWIVEHKLLDFDDLAKKAASIGGDFGRGLVNGIRSTRVMDAVFLVALSGLIYEDAQAIQNNERVLSNTLSVVSLTADVASIVLGFANMANPHMVTTLAIVAASTGLASWIVNAENK